MSWSDFLILKKLSSEKLKNKMLPFKMIHSMNIWFLNFWQLECLSPKEFIEYIIFEEFRNKFHCSGNWRVKKMNKSFYIIIHYSWIYIQFSWKCQNPNNSVNIASLFVDCMLKICKIKAREKYHIFSSHSNEWDSNNKITGNKIFYW